MCVGDKGPVTNSLREYVCIWAPIEKKTDVQIRMINCADLSPCILTSDTWFRRHVTHSLAGFILFELQGNRRTSQHARRERKYMSPVADSAANKFLLIWARTVVNERVTETDTVRKREHGELGHCLAELPVISRSWTCRDCRPGWRSGVHTITVCSTGGVSAGGKSALWPPLHSQHIRPQPSHLLTHIPHIFPLLACPSSSRLCFNSTSADISLHLSKKRSTCDLCCCTASLVETCWWAQKKVRRRFLVLTNITCRNVKRSHAVQTSPRCKTRTTILHQIGRGVKELFFSLSLTLSAVKAPHRLRWEREVTPARLQLSKLPADVRFWGNTHVHLHTDCVASTRGMFLGTHSSLVQSHLNTLHTACLLL